LLLLERNHLILSLEPIDEFQVQDCQLLRLRKRMGRRARKLTMPNWHDLMKRKRRKEGVHLHRGT
jgi:hypothetical protein